MESNVSNEKTVVVPKGPITLLMTKNGPIMIVTNDSKLPSQKVLNETKQTLGLASSKVQAGTGQHVHGTQATKGKGDASNVEPKEVVNILTASATERSKSARAKMLIDGLASTQPIRNTENVTSIYKSQNPGIQWFNKTTNYSDYSGKSKSNTLTATESSSTASKSNILTATEGSTTAPKSNILTAVEYERIKSVRAKRLIDSLQEDWEDELTENEMLNHSNRDPGIQWFKKSSAQDDRIDSTEKPSENNTKDTAFSSKNTSTSHVELENQNHLYSCHKCGEKFEKIDSMMKHFVTHKKEDSTKPPVKKLKANIKETKKVADSKQKVDCTEAKNMQSYKNILEDEIDKATSSCPTCGKKFTQKHSLLSHLESHIGEKPLSCDICGRSFLLPNGLKRHEKLHLQGKIDCRICGKIFKTTHAKKTHMKRKHGKNEDIPEEEKFICGVCDMSFLTKIDLLQHLSEHTENDEQIELFEENFLCPYCENVFHNRDDLIKHFEAVHV